MSLAGRREALQAEARRVSFERRVLRLEMQLSAEREVREMLLDNLRGRFQDVEDSGRTLKLRADTLDSRVDGVVLFVGQLNQRVTALEAGVPAPEPPPEEPPLE